LILPSDISRKFRFAKKVSFVFVLDRNGVHQNNGKMGGLPVLLVLALVELLQRGQIDDVPRHSLFICISAKICHIAVNLFC